MISQLTVDPSTTLRATLLTVVMIDNQDTAVPCPYNKSGAPETALPCPLYHFGAAGIDIKSGSIGINITYNQDTAVPFPYN